VTVIPLDDVVEVDAGTPPGEGDLGNEDDSDRFMSFGRKTFECKSLNQKERTGLQITLYNLTYTVPTRGGGGAKTKTKNNEEQKQKQQKDTNSNEKILLGGYRKLCGTIDPGQMVALMGASGAGKTTLLDIICHRKTVGKVSGLIIYDGHEPTTEEVQVRMYTLALPAYT
jgi:ABC-type glutathione transport system ATPase component